MALENKPLVSVIAVSYNHGKYIKEAIYSLLNQDYSPLEIIISDDHSTDNSFEIAQKIISQYQGPHQIILKQNSQNLGIGGNVSAALQLAKGELLVSADCDDISEPHRITRLVKLWQSQTHKPYLITSDAWDTSPSGEDLKIKRCGNLEDIRSINEWTKQKPHFFGCTNMYTRDLIEKFGLLQAGCGSTDQIMVFRSILLGGALSLHEPLVHHRQGGVTGNKPMNVTDKVNRLLNESSRTIADIEQHIDDAEKFGFENVIREHFKDRLAEAKLIPKLLNAKSFKEELKIFLQERETPFFKRIRLLSYVALPFMHRVIFKVKREMKK
jgi:glycosyltransferase involved in cell wall biosynthesis